MQFCSLAGFYGSHYFIKRPPLRFQLWQFYGFCRNQVQKSGIVFDKQHSR